MKAWYSVVCVCCPASEGFRRYPNDISARGRLALDSCFEKQLASMFNSPPLLQEEAEEGDSCVVDAEVEKKPVMTHQWMRGSIDGSQASKGTVLKPKIP